MPIINSNSRCRYCSRTVIKVNNLDLEPKAVESYRLENNRIASVGKVHPVHLCDRADLAAKLRQDEIEAVKVREIMAKRGWQAVTDRNINGYSVPCALCKAPIGQPCWNMSDVNRSKDAKRVNVNPHPVRSEAALTASGREYYYSKVLKMVVLRPIAQTDSDDVE